jgi:predicted Zn-dependent peptidase
LPHFRSISLGIWVPAGSRNENENINGITHLIEHLIFKGTKKRTSKDIAIGFDSIGAEYNAFTDKENCCIYADFIDTYLENCLELLFDIITEPSFLTENIKTEKKVIVEEIKMVEDNPSENVMNHFYKAIFNNHPLSMPVLGTRKSLRSINKSSMLNYFNDNFNTGNIVISAAGNIKHEKLTEAVKKYTDSIKNKQEKNSFIRFKPSQGEIMRKVPGNKTNSVYLCFGCQSCQRDSDDKYPISLFTNLLGGTMSSRLFQKVREEEGLAYSIFSNNIQYIDTGVILIYAASSPQNTDRILEIIRNEIKDISKYGVKETEFSIARENLKGNIVLGVEDISSRMFRLGKGLLFDKKVLTINEVLKKIDNVKKNDIDDIVSRYFNLDRMSLVLMGKIN